MKRFLIASLVMFLVVMSADAKLTRLAHFRAESLSALSGSASGMALAVEQPMMGMMAMGAMQQSAQEIFGSVDQNKPVYGVVYYKGDLPDLNTVDIEQDFSEMFKLDTNIAIAVMMPIIDTPDIFLKSKGAVDVEDGVFKENDTTWWACKDGYAFKATDPEVLGESVQELRRGLDAQLPGMVVEMILEKPVLDAYSTFMRKLTDSTDTPSEFGFLGDFAHILTEYQAVQTEMTVTFIAQINRLAMGLNYDLAEGFLCEWFAACAPGSDVAKLLAKVSPLPDDMFTMIPSTSPFFVASGKLRDLSGEAKQLMANLQGKLVLKIQDEFIREKVSDALDQMVWMSENIENVLAFSDWDDAGRMVFVSNSQTRDTMRYMDASRKAIDSMMAVLTKVVPEQDFMTFDSETMRGTISFEKVVDFIAAKAGEELDLDPEIKKTLLDLVDSILGHTFEFSSGIHGGGIREVGQAEGAGYSVPEASGSSVVADRVKALLPEAATAKPLQVGFISLGAMMKHLAPRVMKVVGEEDAAVIEALDLLSTVDGGGMMLVSWNENDQFRQVMNISSAEITGFVKFFTALSESMAGQDDLDYETIDWDESADEDEIDEDAEV